MGGDQAGLAAMADRRPLTLPEEKVVEDRDRVEGHDRAREKTGRTVPGVVTEEKTGKEDDTLLDIGF